jgi:hypothetical protein
VVLDVFDEVPDVALLILGVPVEGILHQLSLDLDPVPKDHTLGGVGCRG